MGPFHTRFRGLERSNSAFICEVSASVFRHCDLRSELVLSEYHSVLYVLKRVEMLMFTSAAPQGVAHAESLAYLSRVSRYGRKG